MPKIVISINTFYLTNNDNSSLLELVDYCIRMFFPYARHPLFYCNLLKTQGQYVLQLQF